MKVLITTDTYLKALPTQASELREKNIPNQLINVKAGTALDIVDHAPYEGIPESTADDHLFIQLKQPLQGYEGIRWFIYGLHAQVEGTDPDNNPQEVADPAALKATAPASSARANTSNANAGSASTSNASTSKAAKQPDYGPTISIPGISRPVGIYEPVYFEPSPCHFTWSEFTKGGSRIPVNATITQRIVKLAKYMDGVRGFFGDRPIHITSGYRDPYSNRSVGGARDSRHMYGDAVDFWVEGLDLVDVFYRLKAYHPRGGLAVGRGFVHIDLRPGAAARWTYSGGPQVSLW